MLELTHHTCKYLIPLHKLLKALGDIGHWTAKAIGTGSLVAGAGVLLSCLIDGIGILIKWARKEYSKDPKTNRQLAWKDIKNLFCGALASTPVAGGLGIVVALFVPTIGWGIVGSIAATGVGLMVK